jgi:hypothetical protein
MLELHVQHGAVDQDAGHVMEGALKFKDMTVQEIVSVCIHIRVTCSALRVALR